jgi:hypothetical protein
MILNARKMTVSKRAIGKIVWSQFLFHLKASGRGAIKNFNAMIYYD